MKSLTQLSLASPNVNSMLYLWPFLSITSVCSIALWDKEVSGVYVFDRS